MTTKERIKAEIEHVSDEEELNELYELVKGFTESRRHSNGGKIAGKQSLMSKLRSIAIDAPEDFSANFEQYSSGEKRAESDLH
jgi:hypothetical protein